MLLARTAAAGPPPAEAYVLHCSGCHGRDGAGVPGLIPSLRDLGEVVAHTGGRAYLASVPGVAQAPLPDAELADLLTWIARTLSRIDGFDAYDADEVARWRRAPLRDPASVRP